MRSELSLYGLYQYDNTILGGLYLPDGVDLDNFKERLLYETMDLEILYPDPKFLARAIYVWARSMRNSWNRMREALYAQYIPIENYNRSETWTDNSTRTDNLTASQTGSSTGSGTIGGTNGSTTTHSQKGYNSGGMITSEKDQVDTTTSNTTSDSTTTSNTVTNTGTVGNTASRIGNIHGNIGITTNQQMITAEIELRCNYEFETIVINQFKQRFCLLVY